MLMFSLAQNDMFRVARVDFTVKTGNVRPGNKYKYGPGNEKNENKTENG